MGMLALAMKSANFLVYHWRTCLLMAHGPSHSGARSQLSCQHQTIATEPVP